ncbi:MAG: alpha/beta hydrolase [Deltaproteobacteria bacterium]|nr:alpha/beta hydrolase [Deltaproteobacteria bacterium]
MKRSARRLLATFACIVVLSGCAISPVGVKRMDPRTVHRTLTANVLTAGKPSIPTLNVLHRRDLFQRFDKDPAGALAALHRVAVAEDDTDAYFALAELAFLHGERKKDRSYSIAAAIYAWSFLFGAQPPDSFDPRLRVATDLYNRGLTAGLEEGNKRGVLLDGRSVALPFGQLQFAFDAKVLDWNGRHLRDFMPVAELEVHGLDNRFRTPGIGAPLAASAAAVSTDQPKDDLLAPRLKIPVTALLRIENVRAQIASGNVTATLELHTDPNETSVNVGGRSIALEKEQTATIAAMLAESPVIKQEIQAFLGAVTRTSATKSGLVALRPHTAGRIPVVFVHGTASSPARWAEMVNVLDNDPRINTRFEPWFFAYDSSSPILYSSYLLRRALQDTVVRLDPTGSDPGLQDMVVIGHSQGGLLTKMTAVSSGTSFWENLTKKSFEEVKMNDKDRALWREIIFVEPLPFVRRVVFVCTPHRGSYLAASDWIRSIITRLVTLPITVTQITADLVTLNPDLASMAALRRVNAVENMTPGNRFVRTLSGLPVTAGVTAHSIIAVQGDGPIEKGDDGVVRYESAHIDGVESEKIVHSSHSTQAVPETIEEVRRILLEHAAAAQP